MSDLLPCICPSAHISTIFFQNRNILYGVNHGESHVLVLQMQRDSDSWVWPNTGFSSIDFLMGRVVSAILC